jgi:hypothetical protein
VFVKKLLALEMLQNFLISEISNKVVVVGAWLWPEQLSVGGWPWPKQLSADGFLCFQELTRYAVA